jgi:hypothetical protein
MAEYAPEPEYAPTSPGSKLVREKILGRVLVERPEPPPPTPTPVE